MKKIRLVKNTGVLALTVMAITGGTISPASIFAEVKTDGTSSGQQIGAETETKEAIANINSKEWETIDQLFTSASRERLADGVDQETINQVRILIDQVPNNDEKKEMNIAITKAEIYLKLKTIFTDQTHSVVSDKTDQQIINQVKELIESLPNSIEKNSFNDLIQIAQDVVDKNEQNMAHSGENEINDVSENNEKEKAQSDELKKDFKALETIGTQEIGFLGGNNQQFMTLKVENGKLTVHVLDGTPDATDGNLYTAISITRAGATIYGNFFDGNINYPEMTETTSLREGDRIHIIHKSKSKYQSNQDSLIPEFPEEEGRMFEIDYTVIDNQLVLDEWRVQKQVDALFVGGNYEELEEDVDQVVVDKAKELVFTLLDERKRDKLLELIEKAEALLELKKVVITDISTYTEGNSSYVMGKYKGDNVTFMTLEVNGERKSTVRPTISGSFSYYFPGLKTTDKVEYILFDAQYNVLARREVTVVTSTPVAITSVDDYAEGSSSYATGTYTGNNVAFMRVEVDGEKKPLIRPTTPGIFSYYIRGLKATDKVEYVLFDATYREIARQEVTITPSSTAITKIDNYIQGSSSYVTGTYTGDNVAFMRVEVDGEKKPLIRSTTPGIFSYYVRGLKATDKVEYVLFDATYKEIARQEVTITPSSTAITKIDDYIQGSSSYVTGTYTGDNVAFMRVEVDGEKKPLIRPTTPGIFSYYIRGLKATDKVEYVLFDATYKEIARQEVTITSANQ
ncbi:immunoglobulin-like domain-containing protein [Enterococcus faecium]|uniref:immunoglobulin-like domain-containing protein n=1 Tax=Enterococcus faecium TaxID=1352 RepID=UPI0023B30CC7|nr:immunoglobulin-like domain-containing protein [Enterococcus faecium]